MDISNWSMSQILELPDHLFGRRYMISCGLTATGFDTLYDISELGLPERCVIWELCVVYNATVAGYGSISFAIGDQLPTTLSEFIGHEPLFPGLGLQRAGYREFAVGRGAAFNMRRLKICVSSGGRRLIIRFSALATGISIMNSSIVVSAIPRSIPEWYG